jgi:protein O-GlcNAc transferase
MSAATMIAPTFAQALEQALALHQQGQIALARTHYEALLRVSPNEPTVLEYAGVAALQMQDFESAYLWLGQAHKLSPDDFELLANYALAAARLGKLEEARAGLIRVTQATGAASAFVNLGNVCEQLGDRAGALAALQAAVRRAPNNVEALTNLGRVLTAQRSLDEAVAVLTRALTLNPNHATAALNLGNALKDMGDMERAAASYEAALRARPSHLQSHSASLLAACYRPLSRDAWRAKLAAFAAELPTASPRWPAQRLADGRIHVALVSADFRAHAVAAYLLSWLPHLDRGRFKLSLYSNHAGRDATSKSLAAYADAWVDALGMSDVALAAHMRHAGVAIAIDLSGHSAGNRLAAFATRLAPVQATWLGFLGSTGVPAMDYRLTDAVADGAAAAEWHTEALIHLPDALWCYSPMDAQPVFAEAVGRPFTFACLNNPAKLGDEALALWAQLLARHPAAHLVLHAHDHAGLRGRILQQLSRSGAQTSQIEFVGFMARGEYWQTLSRVDVALDPFPYSGGATTCDALLAGVPVVTLAAEFTAGQPFSRSSASSLHASGNGAWLAATSAQYLEIAGALALAGPRGAAERSQLNQAVCASALMDAPRFTRALEAAFQRMFDTA